METNIIYCGDNLEILSGLPADSIDLIYADPPFFSNRHYEVIWKDGAELRAFDDRWQGGIEHYIGWMEHRLRECHRVLKPTGSMYLHCDWHANSYLRVKMDGIFGYDNYQNEVIWHYGLGGSSAERWSRKHDNILFYTKSKTWNYKPEMVKATSQKMAGQLKKLDDVWDIPTINNMAHERLGYPTQKPEKLLKRIIEASSNKDDIVLDPFCGCGTAISVAYQLGRQYVGIDVSPTACRMMAERLQKIGGAPKLVNMPTIMENVKMLAPFEFQNWVINKIHATPQHTKSNDKGVDGWTYMLHEPIQIKQSENIGRNVIDNFEAAIQRAGNKKGYIYALSFGKGAYEEVARVKNDGLDITLIKVEELLK